VKKLIATMLTMAVALVLGLGPVGCTKKDADKKADTKMDKKDDAKKDDAKKDDAKKDEKK
jgi:hypothetical protein